jgi:biopolymer transport protein ExbB
MLPKLITHGGPMIWLLFLASSLAVALVVDRLLHYHRAQINSMEFLTGIRNVLRRENVVEAISICDATPGPVARLVKVAILNREKSREAIRESLEDAGMMEVPRLEDKLSLLATIAQLAPLLGLLGTVLGFIKVFAALQLAGGQAHIDQLSGGIWQALISTAVGLAVAIPCYAAHNYLVNRVGIIVLDMERSANEILNLVTDGSQPKGPRNGDAGTP